MRRALLLPALLTACAGDDGVKIINSDPAATIVQPTDGAAYGEGEVIELQGVVSDDDDEESALEVTWRIDGVDACGPVAPEVDGDTRCEVSPGPGSHEVTLLVTDPEGAAASTTATFTVTPNAAPTAALEAPEDGAVLTEGALLVFQGTVSDDQDDPADLAVWWSSSVQDLSGLDLTVNSDGSVTASGTLVAGEHALALHVQDSGGKSSSDSVLVVVEPANSAPSCTIDNPADETTVDLDEGVEVHATVADPDQAPDTLAVTWSSDRDGALGASTPDSAGAVVAVLDLSLGAHTLTMTVEDDDGQTCTDNLRLDVDSAPAVEILDPEDGATVQQEEDTLVQVLVTDATDREDVLEVTWQSDLDGALGEGNPDSDGDLSFLLAGLSAGTHRLRVSATDTAGLTGTASIDLVVNAAPDAPSVTIAPAAPYTDDPLVATATGGGDPDGGAFTYSYQWSVDGAAAGYTGTTVPASATTKGETWAVRVTAVDGDGGESSAGADAVVILNTPPETEAPSLTPASPSTDQDLTCSPGASSDLDGDTVSLAYTWQVDGVAIPITSATLDASYTARGDVIRCGATPSDGEESGSTQWSSTVTVQNSAPTTTTPTLSPASPYTDDDLVCTAGTSTDADGDTVSLAYSWQVDGGTLAVTSGTLDAAYTARTDVVRCGVTPSDGTTTGTTAWSSTVTVLNSAPTASGVAISPASPDTSDSLTCSASGADLDGDTVTLSYRWEIDGATVGSGATLAAGATSKGDDVFCVVTPSDGSTSGGEVSASVTIGDSAPTLTSLSITPAAPTVSSTLTANATATDADGETVSYTYAWRVGGATVGTSSTLSGEFEKGDSVQVTVTPRADGVAGDSDATSVTIQNSPPTAPTVSVSPDEPYAGEDALTCSIDSPSTDADGDSVSYAVDWTVNGVDAGIGGYTVDFDETAPGDLWVCTVTPDDGEDEGTPTSASVTVRGDPVDYAHVQYPCSISTTTGALVDIYAEVYELGVTEGAGQGAGIEGEGGWGPTDADPSDDPDAWEWFEAVYNSDADGLTSGDRSNDEYLAILTAPDAAGSYRYAFRFTTDGGASWVYADLGDYCGYEGTTDGFDVDDAGPMTVSD